MLKRTLAALIVALTAFCGGTAQAEPLKLTFSTGSVGGGFFAVGSGIAGFASQKIPGISITAISAAGVVESINRLEQGKTDFAMLNTQDPPLAWEGKAPYKKQYRNMRGMGILYMQAAQPYTLKSSGIRTFKDLKGKKVVGPKGTVLHQLLVAALKKEGMTIKDVDFISMDPAKAMTAVLSGSADAGLVAAGLIIKANAEGAKTITTCEGLVEPNLVMAVRQAFVDQYPEAYERVVATNRAALKWIREHKAEALAMGAKEQGISIENAEKLYDWSGFYDVLTEADVKGLAADQQFLIDNGMMEKAVDVRSLILPGAMK